MEHSDYDCDESMHIHRSMRIVEDSEETQHSYIIMPNDSLKFKWDILIILGAILNCFCIPIQIAFNPKSMQGPEFQMINYVIDFIFVCDIFVSLRTSYIDNMG